ncbi:c-type cytochrome [Arenicella sp.]|nr:c-type cytochrome [Arenicella sp.]
MHQFKCVVVFLSVALMGDSVLAQQYALDSQEGVAGAELFAVCAFCHGAQGQGGPALDAPPLAGMQAWYVAAQLIAFQQGYRGNHPDDVPGLQMSIVSGAVRNAATIKNIAEYIQSMPTDAPLELARNGEMAGTARPFIWRSKYAKLEHPEPANIDKGRILYASCGTCHGRQAQGNRILRAPKLTGLTAKYLHRQLQYYQDRIRGADPRDTYGVQMAVYADMLKDNQAIADVVAYIESMEVAQ